MGQSKPITKPVILVVEDQSILRMAAVGVIEDAGFEAVEAEGSTEAIRMLEGRADIRILFTDIDMPGGIDGLRLAGLVRDRWPSIGVIITSGMPEPRAEEIPEGGLFFAKPYDLEEVTAAMRNMAL